LLRVRLKDPCRPGLEGGILHHCFGIIPAIAVAKASPRRTKNLPLPR
jgi:hypothetical protein